MLGNTLSNAGLVGATTPRNPTQVDTKINRLRNLVSDLEKQLSNLSEKLHPILRNTPSGQSNGNAKEVEVLTPLASILEEVAQKVEMLVYGTAELKDRVDI